MIKALSTVKEQPEIQDILKAYHNDFKYFSNKTGSEINELEQLYEIYLLLMVQVTSQP